MSKLIDDPKVQALVAKERAAVHKALHKRLKEAVKTMPVPEDQAHARVQKDMAKHLLSEAKAFAEAGSEA